MSKESGRAGRADYGLDAPLVVRNLLVVGGIGVIALATRLAGIWNSHSWIARLGYPAISAGLCCGAMGLWMIYSSKIGKVREREKFLDKIDWRGDEAVLDVGCGRGLFLIGAARRLTRGGRAVGIDLWQAEDLSGNSPAATINNAKLEAVGDRVEVQTADARRMPFPDATFDVVLASMSLHNIYKSGERQNALREIARVLKPGGRVLLVDIRHTPEYAATLRASGLPDARAVKSLASHLLTIITFGSLRPGYVTAKKVDSVKD